MITAAEAAKIMRIRTSVIYDMVKRGTIKPVSKGPGPTGRWLFEPAEVERAAAARTKQCDGLNLDEFCERVPGVTYRQIDYWSAMGKITSHSHSRAQNGVVLEQHGSGLQRCWPLDQVQLAGRLAKLLELGFEMATAERLARSEFELNMVMSELSRLDYDGVTV